MNYYQNLIKQQIIITNCILTSEIFLESGCSKEENNKFIVNNISSNKFLDDNKIKESFDDYYIKNITELLIILNEYYLSLDINFSAVLSLEYNNIFIENKYDTLEDKRHNGICRIFISDNKDNKIYNFNIDKDLENRINKFIKNIKNKKRKIKKENQNSEKIFTNSQSIIFLEGSGGYFIHEVLGHLVESDYIVNKYSIIGNNYNIGDYIGNELLNVSDDPLKCKDMIDLGFIDDEGEIMHNIDIIKNGKLSGILCNQKDSEKYGNNLKGCARRQSYQYKNIPRMRNTFIHPNIKGMNEKQIIKDMNKAIGVNQIYSGYVNPITGQFQLQGEGYVIKNGVIHNKIKKLTISGDLIKSLQDIKLIGKEFFSFPVYCSKFNQTIPVCVGAPTIVVDNLNMVGEIYDY